MTYEEWIKYAELVLLQYKEGAIFAAEAFNAIISKALEVEQFHICSACGLDLDDCDCEHKEQSS